MSLLGMRVGGAAALELISSAGKQWISTYCQSSRAKRSRIAFRAFQLSLLMLISAAAVPSQAFAISAACQAVNAGTVGSGNSGIPASLSGTYVVSSDGVSSSTNFTDASLEFDVGDVISYTTSNVSTPPPYIHVVMYDTDFLPRSGSVRNRTSAASGTMTISSKTDYLALAAADYQIDAGNNISAREPARWGSSVMIQVSCSGVTVANPTISTVSVPANGTYPISTPLDFTIKYDSAVTVTGTPQMALTVGSATRQATYVSGSGTTDLQFRYAVTAGDLDTDGIAIGALSLNGGTINNGSTAANLTLNGVGSTAGVLVDGVRPTVSSITLDGSPAANAATVSFTVNFSEPVSSVSASAFTLTTTGNLVSSITNVSASGATASVTVGITSGDGNLRLDALSNTPIADSAGNTLSASYTSGATHTVQQSAVPGAPTIGTASAGDGQASVSFTGPSSTGSSAISGYTVTSSPGGIVATGASSPITVAGLANGTAYTFTVIATNTTGPGSASAASNSITPAASQIITFTNPGAQSFGTALTLSAVSTSGQPVTFTSSTQAVCTVSTVGALTFISTGTCTITADQPGGGAYLAASPVVQSFTVNAMVPDAPAIGTASAGDGQASVSFTAPSNTGGSAISGYTVTSNPGGITMTGTSSPITVAGLANGTAYTFTVTATNGVGAGSASAASNAATPTAALQPPVANAVVATVAANSSGNAITLNITGGTAGSVTVESAASHGTATASVASISYTPTAGYSGSDSFTYTATNAAGTSTAATVTVTVSAPIFVFSPPSGALAAGTVTTAYSNVAVATSGGTSPYSYALASGSLPPGLSLSPAGTITGTPTTIGNANFTITATDANNRTGTASYSIAIVAQPPAAGPTLVANAVSATVSANSTDNAITLNITDGTASSVAVASAASHGTATASGSSITYTPTAGYSGPDSFTYTATNAAGTSSAATVTITVLPPAFAFSPSSGALPAATAGKSYASVTVAASGGTSPYSYAVTSGALPAGLSLSSAGTIDGTPTTAGSYSFTITAVDANNIKSSASYSMTVNPAAAFVFSQSGGALTKAMAGEAYAQAITAKGGTGSLIYSLVSGALPKGMILNISTGELSGPLEAGTEGDYSFSIQVRDGNGVTGTASYTLKVEPRAVTVADKVVSVAAGTTPANVNLASGATGGPFVAAELSFLEPTSAGTATIVNGEFAQASGQAPTGWYLKFIPNPAYSGNVRVGFRLTSALGISNSGTVVYDVAYDAAQVADDVDALVHGFVKTRQNLIASGIKVPGLAERRKMARSTTPGRAAMSPSDQGIALGFSTSLAELEAARDSADGVFAGELSPFNIWIDGTFVAHNRDENGSKWGGFAMINMGADYLLSEKALLGLSFHYDRMTDPTDEDAKLTGNGWLAGPYASFEIGKNIFWDTSLLYGGSSNTIDTQFWDGSFDTSRFMIDTAIKGRWDIDSATVVTPRLRAVYFSEKVDDYAVENGAGDAIDIEGFSEDQFRVSLGAEIARQFTLENEMELTPKLGGVVGFSGLDGSGVFGSISLGASLETAENWSMEADLLFNIEGDGQKSVGAKVGVSGQF